MSFVSPLCRFGMASKECRRLQALNQYSIFNTQWLFTSPVDKSNQASQSSEGDANRPRRRLRMLRAVVDSRNKVNPRPCRHGLPEGWVETPDRIAAIPFQPWRLTGDEVFYLRWSGRNDEPC